MKKRKHALFVVSFVLFCLATSRQLANANFQMPKPPVLPPTIEVKKEISKPKNQKRMAVRLTGYYRVLPGQRKYKISYKADKRLNGPGKTTRSGKIPAIGIAATDWQILPQGTKFRILGCDIPLDNHNPKPIKDMIFQVEDTGGGVKGRHVDIFTGSGDQGRETAEKINDLQTRKFVIEMID